MAHVLQLSQTSQSVPRRDQHWTSGLDTRAWLESAQFEVLDMARVSDRPGGERFQPVMVGIGSGMSVPSPWNGQEGEVSGSRGASGLTVTVVISKWRRTAWFERCLRALEQHTRSPVEVIVVGQAENTEAQVVLTRRPSGRGSSSVGSQCTGPAMWRLYAGDSLMRPTRWLLTSTMIRNHRLLGLPLCWSRLAIPGWRV